MSFGGLEWYEPVSEEEYKAKRRAMDGDAGGKDGGV